MNAWTILEVATLIAASAFIVGGQRLTSPLLTEIGIALTGISALVIGLEALVKRKIVLPSRLLPGVILVVIGLAATCLGVLEILQPQVFDRIGGGFLEVLFGAQ